MSGSFLQPDKILGVAPGLTLVVKTLVKEHTDKICTHCCGTHTGGEASARCVTGTSLAALVIEMGTGTNGLAFTALGIERWFVQGVVLTIEITTARRGEHVFNSINVTRAVRRLRSRMGLSSGARIQRCSDEEQP
jgi:hypothetical protein